MRTTFTLLGHTSMALGFIGIVVPLLPTTPFVLLAAACYSRGSERFRSWLHRHPRYGPMIDSWQERGAIGARAKILATAMILASGALSVAKFGLPWAIAIVAASSLMVTFILTRPS